MGATAEAMLTDVVQGFNTSPNGITYYRGEIAHTASVAGYPPNIDTATLARGMRTRRVGQAHYEIRDAVNYGIHLEMGTEHMRARPFIAPVFERWNSEFGRFVERESDLLR